MLLKRLFPILETSPEEKARLSKINRTIDALFEEGKTEEAQKLKGNSIKRVTLLYGPWVCNFKCPKYCYTMGTSDDIHVLTVDQVIDTIEQSREIGAQVTYWPGNGELTLLRTFWSIMDYQAENDLPAVLFTNGSIFHNDNISKGVLGKGSDDLVDSLNTKYKGLHLLIKYWHSVDQKAAEMVGIDGMDYPYKKINGRNVPLSLIKLLDKVGREKIGVQVVVSKENYQDVIENILPTVEELGIYAYVEPPIFSGNATDGQEELSLTPEQYNKLNDIFSSGGNYCEKRQSTELIIKDTMLTPGIAIPPRSEDTILDKSGNVKDIFKIFHNEYFRYMRKVSEQQGGCLCRKFWNSI